MPGANDILFLYFALWLLHHFPDLLFLEVDGGGSNGGGGGGGGLNASAAEYRALMSTEVATFVAAANAIGCKVAEATALAETCFKDLEVGKLVEKASVCSKPSDLQGQSYDSPHVVVKAHLPIKSRVLQIEHGIYLYDLIEL